MSVVSNKASRLFIILSGFFLANALLAEFIGVKIFSLEATLGFENLDWNILGHKLSMQLTAGVLLWPVVFVMTDIINEYYGSKGVRFLSYGAVVIILYAFVMIFLAIGLEPANFWVTSGKKNLNVDNMQLSYNAIFGQGLWIIVGSVIAFLVGQIIDVAIFQQIKKRTGEGKVWLRATGSTLVSQFIDSFVVLYIAFYLGADWALDKVLAIGLMNYIYKFTVAISLTPALYFVHHVIDNYLGEELANKLKTEAMSK